MVEKQELRKYFFILLHWWWLIVLCAGLGGGSAYVYNRRLAPVYSASATLLISQSPASGMTDYTALMTSERLARTYSEMLSAQPVLQVVVDRLELDESAASLARRVSVQVVKDTQLIRLQVQDNDPARAAQIANAIVDAFVTQNEALFRSRYAESMLAIEQQISELTALMAETQAEIDALAGASGAQAQTDLARLQTIMASYRNTHVSLIQNYESMRFSALQASDNVQLFQPAQVPAAPISPQPLRNAILGAVTGAMIAVGIAFLIEYLDDTIKSPDDVRAALELDTLGTIGEMAEGEEWVTVDAPRSPVAEAYRVLRTNIRFSGVDKPLRTLLVTSAGSLEGKSTTVANLAAAMAQSGLKVIAIDADLRRPRLSKLFDLPSGDGLTESLVQGRVNGNLHAVERVEGLQSLTSGSTPPNPAELLGSQRMRDMLDELQQEADMVIIDSPPILPVTDAAVLAQIVDGVLLVIEAGRTRSDAARHAVENLLQVGANVIGVVLAAVPANGSRYYYYYYDRDYYSADGDRGDGRSKRRRRNKNLVAQVRRWAGKRTRDKRPEAR